MPISTVVITEYSREIVENLKDFGQICRVTVTRFSTSLMVTQDGGFAMCRLAYELMRVNIGQAKLSDIGTNDMDIDVGSDMKDKADIIRNGTDCSEKTNKCSSTSQRTLTDKLKTDIEGFGIVSRKMDKDASENGHGAEDGSVNGSDVCADACESGAEDANEVSCDGSDSICVNNNSRDVDDVDEDSNTVSEITQSSDQVPGSREDSMDVGDADGAECSRSGESARESMERNTDNCDDSAKGVTVVSDKSNDNSKDAIESNSRDSCVDLTSESNENTTDSVEMRGKPGQKDKGGNNTESPSRQQTKDTSQKDNKLITVTRESPEKESKVDEKPQTKPTKVDSVLASDKPRGGSSSGSENLRPFARLLFDLGLDLTRQHVYKDLIRVQTKKQQHNKLNNKDEKQLDKLKDAYTYLVEKNKYFALDSHKCPRCDHKRESVNALEFHKEFDHRGACTMCEFVTGNASAYYFHMEAEHNRQGRVEPVLGLYVCPYCPYEHHNARKNYLKHVMKCEKAFILKQNLKPMPADCDIPLKTSPMSIHQTIGAKNIRQPPPLIKKPELSMPHISPATRNFAPSVLGGVTRSLLPGQLTLPPWLNIQESQGPQLVQMGNQYFLVVTQNGQTFMTPMTIGTVADVPSTIQQVGRQPKTGSRGTDSKTKGSARGAFEICEICGGFVKDRDSLRIHFFWAHKIEIHPLLMKDREPALKCNHVNCSRRFWTYQGYQRHVTVTHGGEAGKAPTPGMTCYVCGVNTVDFITHMTSKHPQVVKHMLSQMRCVVCQDALPTETALESHMFIEHKDVVTKYGSLITGPKKNIPGQSQEKAQSKANSSSKGSPSVAAVDTLIECSYCDAEFTSSGAYAAHFSKQHANIKESCSVCKEDVLVGQQFIDHVTDKHLKKLSIPVKRISKETVEKLSPPATRSRKRASDEVIVIDLEDQKRQKLHVGGDGSSVDHKTKKMVTRNSGKKVTEEVIEVDGEEVVIQKVDD
ncbi:hypothetical protein LSH36_270g02012 [Paralvinella palmiformis]|uniref:C2H2-type domain-containing protein n=1 Tax=Paralvinella palmiformis TaxID=53620 RepID=A0AAD9N2J0_9ANNE|nr:hypothetical protein LSH36_270g02012 [Paralvinella palmiformis]